MSQKSFLDNKKNHNQHMENSICFVDFFLKASLNDWNKNAHLNKNFVTIFTCKACALWVAMSRDKFCACITINLENISHAEAWHYKELKGNLDTKVPEQAIPGSGEECPPTWIMLLSEFFSCDPYKYDPDKSDLWNENWKM